MVESVLARPMFGGEIVPPIQNQNQFPQGNSTKPSSAITDNSVPSIDFNDPQYQQPLGLEEIYAKTREVWTPEVIRKQYEEYAGEEKTFDDFAKIYEASETVEKAPEDNMKFEKNLALARLGLNLMKPTQGGQLTPAIAQAGEVFLNDLAGMNEQKRKQKAARYEEEKANERAKREYVLKALDNQRDVRDAEEFKIFEKALQFNSTNEAATTRYQRELAKQFYGYQYSNDQSAIENNYKILKEFKKDPVVFAIPGGFGGNPEFKTGYVAYNDLGEPVNMIPQQKDGKQTYVPDYELGKSAIKAGFTFNDAGTLDKNSKTQLEIAEKLNGTATALHFIEEIRKTMKKGGAKVGAPGTIKGFIQDVKGTALDVADWAGKNGLIDGDKYTASINKLQGSTNNDLAYHYFEDTGQRDYTADPVYQELFNSQNLVNQGFDKDIVQNMIRVNSIYYALARSRKSTGRLNMDDINNAKEALQLYNITTPILKVEAALEGVEDELRRYHQAQMQAFEVSGGDEGLLVNYKKSASWNNTTEDNPAVIGGYEESTDITDVSGFSETIPDGSN